MGATRQLCQGIVANAIPAASAALSANSHSDSATRSPHPASYCGIAAKATGNALTLSTSTGLSNYPISNFSSYR